MPEPWIAKMESYLARGFRGSQAPCPKCSEWGGLMSNGMVWNEFIPSKDENHATVYWAVHCVKCGFHVQHREGYVLIKTEFGNYSARYDWEENA